MDDIRGFYGKYRWLSNFWKAPVIFDGLWFPTVENAYQAAKERTRQQRMSYMNVKPEMAKKMGCDVELRDDWENVKFDIMHDLVFQKFNDNEKLGGKLLATGEVSIIEDNTWGDIYWGVCKGVGENNLGKILMDVRDSLVSKHLTTSTMEVDDEVS